MEAKEISEKPVDKNAARVSKIKLNMREAIEVNFLREGLQVGRLYGYLEDLSKLRHLLEDMGPEIPKMLNDIELQLNEKNSD